MVTNEMAHKLMGGEFINVNCWLNENEMIVGKELHFFTVTIIF